MEPVIKSIQDKKLVGQRMTMSLEDYRIGKLWRTFSPRRKEILHPVNTDMISLAVYPPDYFRHFQPSTAFERWAAVEVQHYEHIPTDMETFDLPGGLYAVFANKGLSSDNSLFQYIFGTWLPPSTF